jgi:transcriptional regulator with XRE-family HTH domain
MPEKLIVGKRIREERKRRNLTLQEMAEHVGLSVPYLSQIENGRVNINISNLESISKALDVPIINFFVNGPLPEINVVRQNERRWFALADEVAESLLIKSGSNLEICVLRLKPFSNTAQDSSHQGEEFSYVIRGRVRMMLDEQPPYDLDEGDMIYYRSEITHRWQNLGDSDAEVLVVNTPATY